jgi:hypothetical protein
LVATPVSTVARTFDQLCANGETAHVTPKPHIAESEWLLKLM